LGNAAAVTGWRIPRDEYQEHVITALAGLAAENRCLVPANSFAEYAPESNPETGKKDVVWFALNESRPGYGPNSRATAAPSQSRYRGRTTSMVF
jgi:hypothetical protein